MNENLERFIIYIS